MAEESDTAHDENRSSGGYAKIARKWSSLSTNLLASGLVVVLAIALVRYVAPWWKQEQPPSANAHVADTVGQRIATDDAHGVLSGFGDLTDALRQARVVGDRATVTHHLRQLCRQAVETAGRKNRNIGTAELRLLHRLASDSPVQVEANRWRMYELHGPAPLVAVVAWTDPSPPAVNQASRDHLAQGVMSWGIAVPGEKDQWTVFVYPGGGDKISAMPISQLELPAGTIRTMSLRGENGASMMAFRGSVDVAACRRHFEQWATATKTSQIAPWRKLGKQWLARFGDQQTGWVDVHLFEEAGKLTGGFLSISQRTAPTISSTHAPPKEATP